MEGIRRYEMYFEGKWLGSIDLSLMLPELNLHSNTAYVISEYSITRELHGNI